MESSAIKALERLAEEISYRNLFGASRSLTEVVDRLMLLVTHREHLAKAEPSADVQEWALQLRAIMV